MNIRFARSGGFGGMRREARIDTRSLSAAERGALEQLVGDAGFFSLPEKFPRPAKGADYFTYTLTVEEGGRRHTVEVAQPSVPESLRPLIRELSKRL